MIGRGNHNSNNKSFGISVIGNDIQNGNLVEFIRQHM